MVSWFVWITPRARTSAPYLRVGYRFEMSTVSHSSIARGMIAWSIAIFFSENHKQIKKNTNSGIANTQPTRILRRGGEEGCLSLQRRLMLRQQGMSCSWTDESACREEMSRIKVKSFILIIERSHYDIHSIYVTDIDRRSIEFYSTVLQGLSTRICPTIFDCFESSFLGFIFIKDKLYAINLSWMIGITSMLMIWDWQQQCLIFSQIQIDLLRLNQVFRLPLRFCQQKNNKLNINSLLLNQLLNMSKEEEKSVNTQEEQQEKDDPTLKGLSKGQLKKLREKKKKQQQAAKLKQETEEKSAQKAQVDKIEVKQQKEEAKNQKQPKLTGAALLAKNRIEEQRKLEEKQQRLRLQFVREQQRLRKQEEQRQRVKQQEQKKRIEEIRLEIKRQKNLGIYVKNKDKAKIQLQRQQLEQNQKNQEKKQQDDDQEQQIRQILNQQKKKKQESKLLKDDRLYFARKEGEYRSPVCCILGHVDTGKTTLLDKIRKTNVQEGEAGGITQQIGATFFPSQKLNEQVNKCQSFYPVNVQVPGLLIIDTPGHESFSNLRSRGSSLCDIAILVIDLQHGLENQTLQSLELLSKAKTPFVIALNKIDRSYGWKAKNDHSSYLTLKEQAMQTTDDYSSKVEKIILQLNSKGYNAALYWKNQDPLQYISLVPTSGITGQGIPDLLSVVVHYSLTLQNIKKKIKIRENRFRCTVMEVKMIEGYGTTIDCMLLDGKIKKDDQIVILGFEGPIVTKVKAILTPHPMKQMRIKDEYLHHKEIWGANGVKIAANGLDNAVAGTPLLVANTEAEIQDAKAIVLNEFENVKKKIKLEPLGVGVAASTLGSLQALLEYLKKEKIPVSYVTVGPVSKEDVMKAMKSLLSETPDRRKKEYACMLVFDIKVLPDALKFAQQNQIKIFTANIIYHLTDMFTKFVAQIREERKQKEGKEVVFPCVLKQVACFRKSDPIVLGVDVQSGVIKIGTPIVVYRQKERGDKQVKLGIVESIEHNHKKLKQARKNTGSVAISIRGDPSIQFGKQFNQNDRLASLITRRSINCLSEHYRNETAKEDQQLIIELKKYFNIN